MTISTQKGDDGSTGLWSGERVSKNSARVEAYGTIDELNAHLAEAKHGVTSDTLKTMIVEIQNDLFRVAGSLASLCEYKHPVTNQDVQRITGYVRRFEEEVPLQGFVIPGTTLQSAKLDVCRTVARRAERCIITLHEAEPVSEILLWYINRVSDLLYMLARYEEHQAGTLTHKQW